MKIYNNKDNRITIRVLKRLNYTKLIYRVFCFYSTVVRQEWRKLFNEDSSDRNLNKDKSII